MMKKIMMILFVVAVSVLVTGNSFAADDWAYSSGDDAYTTSAGIQASGDAEIGGDLTVDGDVLIGTDTPSTSGYNPLLFVDGIVEANGGFYHLFELEDNGDYYTTQAYLGTLYGHPLLVFGAAVEGVHTLGQAWYVLEFPVESSPYAAGAFTILDNPTSPSVGFGIQPSGEILFIEGTTLQGTYKEINNDTDGMAQGDFDLEHYGNVVTNAGATGSTTFNLPAAVAGMQITFGVAASQNMDINPDDADQILILTDSAGDAIRCSQVGGNVTLTAIDATNWLVTASQGTWSDIN